MLLALGAGQAIAQYPRPNQNYLPLGGSQIPPAAPTIPGAPNTPVPPSTPSTPGSNGQVMYFCKPADASAPVSGSGGGVTQASDSSRPSTNGGPADNLPPAYLPPPSPPQSSPAPGSLPVSIPALPIGTQNMPQGSQSPNGTPQVNTPPIGNAPYNQPQQGVPPYGGPQQGPPPYGSTQQGTPPYTGPQTGLPPGSRSMESPDPSVLPAEQSTYLPPREQIFGHLRNDAELEKWVMEKVRTNQPTLKADDPSLKFPLQEIIGAGMKYQAKTCLYPAQKVNYESLFVVHRRLLFEEVNSERYGWDLGILQPLVSTAYFYKDLMLLPNSLMSGFAQGFWDTDAGKCLPGTPVPYMLYPPGLTISGGAFEGVVITGLSFAIP